MTDKPTFYTVNEAADILRVHHLTVRKWIKAGKLESVKAGRRVLIPTEAVDAFLKASTEPNS